MFSFRPVDRSSSTVTWFFTSDKYRVRFEPINPAPPVTSIRLLFIVHPHYQGIPIRVVLLKIFVSSMLFYVLLECEMIVFSSFHSKMNDV
jgi:hypothetical protein